MIDDPFADNGLGVFVEDVTFEWFEDQYLEWIRIPGNEQKTREDFDAYFDSSKELQNDLESYINWRIDDTKHPGDFDDPREEALSEYELRMMFEK